MGVTTSNFSELISSERIAGIPEEQIPAVIAQLAAVQSQLAARLLTNPSRRVAEPIEKDTLLTADQAAPLLGVTPHWLYRHWKQLPFARRLSRRTLRFSEIGLRKWQNIKKA